MIVIVSECHLNQENMKISCFHRIILHLHYQTLSNMLWFYENDSILNATFFSKNKQCHRTLEELSSVCAKLKPAGSKNNEILEINVLQKFTLHALLIQVNKNCNSTVLSLGKFLY